MSTLSYTVFSTEKANLTLNEKAALQNRSTRLARGKGLGGSSAINFMHTVYPSRSSIDLWAKLGNEGWSYDDLAPFYLKFGKRHAPSEQMRDISRIGLFDDSLSGEGPVQMSFGGYGVANSAWMDAHIAWGFGPSDVDPASGQTLGAFQNAASIDPVTKTRSYAAPAYYNDSVRKRENLTVMTATVVQKINFEGQDPEVTARGVQLRLEDGSLQDVQSRREVIISAGAVQTPQLLELSGIGDGVLLQKHNIPVIIHNPSVGENLQDHPIVCQSYQARDAIPSLDKFRDLELVQSALSQFEANGDGPLGVAPFSTSYLPMVDGTGRMSVAEKTRLLDKLVPDTTGTHALVKSMLACPDVPALSYVFFPCQTNTDKQVANFGEYWTPKKPENYVTILNALSHPFSRGSCHISSRDIKDDPILNPGYMTHPADLEILARSVMFEDALMKTDPLGSTVKFPHGTRLPGQVPDTLEKAKEIVRDCVVSNMHLSGTCAMLPREQGGVVNNRLLVYGTRNLRVVDASIFPTIPHGNIMTTVYAVAEKASLIIKGDD